MGFTYLFAVAPVAIFFKLTGQKLLDRSLGESSLKSYWLPKQETEQNIRRVQRQYWMSSPKIFLYTPL